MLTKLGPSTGLAVLLLGGFGFNQQSIGSIENRLTTLEVHQGTAASSLGRIERQIDAMDGAWLKPIEALRIQVMANRETIIRLSADMDAMRSKLNPK